MLSFFILLVFVFHGQALQRVEEVDRLDSWGTSNSFLTDLKIPGHTKQTNYDYLVIGKWHSVFGPVNILKVWQNLTIILNNTSLKNLSNIEMQKQIINRYHENNKKVLIKVFGKYDYPFLYNTNSINCANSIAKFVLNNLFDGVLIDYQEKLSLWAFLFRKSYNQIWLKNFKKRLLQQLQTKYVLNKFQGQIKIILKPKQKVQEQRRSSVKGLIREESKSMPKPIYMTYVQNIANWSNVPASIGLPGYAKQNQYNYFTICYWTISGVTKAAQVWQNPLRFLGNQFGSSKKDTLKKLKQIYNSKGICLLIGAHFPSISEDPNIAAKQLATYTSLNYFDGVNVKWDAFRATQQGYAEQWLMYFSSKLRRLLPKAIIAHSPNVQYFDSTYFKKGNYLTLEQKFGSNIDFYCIDYDNHLESSYDTYQGLFIKSKSSDYYQTSVKQLIKRGILPQKIIVSKSTNPLYTNQTSHHIDPRDLNNWREKAKSQFGWDAGYALWQYSSDINGIIVKGVVEGWNYTQN